ncbi:alpha/beta fold hydrolase [Chloroflexota bacterium]
MAVKFIDPNEVQRFKDGINDDPEFGLLAKFLSTDVLIQVDDNMCIFKVRKGAIEEIKLNATMFDTWSFFIKAPSEEWEKLLDPVPTPFYYHFWPAAMHSSFEFGGDLQTLFGYELAVTRLLDLLRILNNPPGTKVMGTVWPEHKIKPIKGKIEPITGRYAHVEVDGIVYRVYYEESGQGIPIICMHTAASDNRQWRHLLNDEEITSKFRIIAPDWPYHGKSLPPDSVEWWKEEYTLTKALALDFPVELSRVLGLDKPVFMGVSVGGQTATDIALEKAEYFRAAIAIETCESIPGWAFDWWVHPQTADHTKTCMWHVMSPHSPEPYKRENIWINGQAFTGVIKGDAFYYSEGHNLTGKTDQFDTSKTPLYILNSEYDPFTPPAVGLDLANKIKGAKFTEMKLLGHYPHSENFTQFKQYIMPILDEIAAR